MIELKNVNKTFKVARRNAGLSEAFKALFKKEFTYVQALSDVSFSIGDGEMVGYIGPNGAGKSSTIKIMSGILTPDSGECVINGRTPWKDRTAHVKEIGVVFGQRSQLWWDVPVADSFYLLKDIYKVDDASYKRTLNDLTQLLDIGEIIRTPARQLSLGQRMRCEIAASLLHSPKVLFLDEPTIGLDAVSKIAVRRFSSVDGYTYSEVLLCFAIVLAAFSLAECFVRGFDAFTGIISNGEFDRIMVRPRNEILQVLSSRIEFSRMGRLLQAIVIFVYAIPASSVVWTAGKIITLIFMLIGGFTVFSGLFIIYASICFFTIEGLEFMNIFTDGGREFGSYPFSIYGKRILKFVTYIVPLALFQYYPFLYLIGKSDRIIYMFLPLVSMLFIIPCLLLWRIGIRHYKSTGS